MNHAKKMKELAIEARLLKYIEQEASLGNLNCYLDCQRFKSKKQIRSILEREGYAVETFEGNILFVSWGGA